MPADILEQSPGFFGNQQHDAELRGARKAPSMVGEVGLRQAEEPEEIARPVGTCLGLELHQDDFCQQPRQRSKDSRVPPAAPPPEVEEEVDPAAGPGTTQAR